MKSRRSCRRPNGTSLARLACGECDDDERRRLAVHLETCTVCAAKLRSLRMVLDALRTHRPQSVDARRDRQYRERLRLVAADIWRQKNERSIPWASLLEAWISQPRRRLARRIVRHDPTGDLPWQRVAEAAIVAPPLHVAVRLNTAEKWQRVAEAAIAAPGIGLL